MQHTCNMLRNIYRMVVAKKINRVLYIHLNPTLVYQTTITDEKKRYWYYIATVGERGDWGTVETYVQD